MAEEKEPKEPAPVEKPSFNKEELKEKVNHASRLSFEDKEIICSLIDKA